MKKALLSVFTILLSLTASAQTETRVFTVGDSDNDGIVNLRDAVNLVQNVVGNIPPQMYYVNIIDRMDHEYVDLGVGTLWATTNIGAFAPEIDGYYYSWGDLHEDNVNKRAYNWETYKYSGNTLNSITKYNRNSANGSVEVTDNVLADADDAACQEWGSEWTIPSYQQWRDLMSGCYWEWTTSYRGSFKAGYIVYKVKDASDKGKFSYNGKPVAEYSVDSNLPDTHIFLPASGRRENSALGNYCTSGHYWSSNSSAEGRTTDDYNRAGSMTFKVSEVSRDHDYRYMGRTIRPVLK